MVQLSVFTVHGSSLFLDAMPDTDDFLVKFTIPHESKDILKEQLKYLGVRESNLFPDLDHLANETKSLRFKPPPVSDQDLEKLKATNSLIGETNSVHQNE